MKRRDFFLGGAAAVAQAADDRAVRIGVIGTGNRGRSLLSVLARMNGVEIPALCDIDAANAERAEAILEKAGRKKPERYGRNEEDFRWLLGRDDLDAVVIAAPWKWHAPMTVAAMKARKYAASEVPIAQTLEECWELVNTHEQTGVPCMMLENWSFRRDNLAVLNMIRKGLLGETVHCHAAHSHDCIDHWFWDPEGKERWPARYLRTRNCDQYPTHSLGPVISWMNIGCGDFFASVSSAATGQRGINAYFARKFGPAHPAAKEKFAQGDIVTSTVRTQTGRTIVVNYDMQLPRPYDNRWMIQGTLGLYDEDKAQVYLTGRSPKYHQWEPFAPYRKEFDHSWWRAMDADTGGDGHGGTDGLELARFVRAVREKTQTPVDVYDSVTMSSLIPLSGASIAKGGVPVACPDFTRGGWKTKKPAFAVEA
jgi:predicted dehydrogenase